MKVQILNPCHETCTKVFHTFKHIIATRDALYTFVDSEDELRGFKYVVA